MAMKASLTTINYAVSDLRHVCRSRMNMEERYLVRGKAYEVAKIAARDGSHVVARV